MRISCDEVSWPLYSAVDSNVICNLSTMIPKEGQSFVMLKCKSYFLTLSVTAIIVARLSAWTVYESCVGALTPSSC